MNQPNALPVSAAQQSEILDVLRGFALLGICIANAGYFSMYIFQSKESAAALPFPEIDKILNYFTLALVDGKFYSIFSLLFGIGFSLIFFGKDTTANTLYIFYRRLFFLFLIGIAHALLIWDGDILIFYSIMGIFLPLFRNVRVRSLVIIAVVLLVLPIFLDVMRVLTNDASNFGNPFKMMALEFDNAHGITEQNLGQWLVVNDTYGDLLDWNRSGFWWSWKLRLESMRPAKVLAMFLLGLAAGKLNIYSRIGEFEPLLKKIVIWGFIVGILSGIAKAFFETDTKKLPDPLGLLDSLSYALNVTPLAIAYCSAIALLHYRTRALSWLRYAGQMALTNYIMQAVISISIYYGIGAAFASRVGPSFFIPVAILIFAAQIIYSKLWLTYFNFGPLEWMWRQLTYGKTLPMRKS